MMTMDDFSKIIDEIVQQNGLDRKTASRYAALIGDTPLRDENRKIIVKENGKEIARIVLD